MSFYLIENNNQLENFHLEGYRDVFVNVVPFSYKEHPTQNDVSLVYVRPWNSLKGYVIIVSHADAFSCDISRVFSKLDSIENLYVVDKKDFLHYFIIHKAKDLTLTTHLPNVDYTNAHLHLYHRFPNKRDINSISISKTGITHHHALLGLPGKGIAIKGLNVCNSWDIEPALRSCSRLLSTVPGCMLSC